jgi:hypothetical protein
MDFGEDMLQHTRDLNRDAARQGIWNVARLCISLVKDGILNACIEHGEGIMALNREIKPASWLIVLLAVLPGLLILLTRRMPAQLTPLPLNTWYLYLGTLVIVVPVILWRKKRFPVWALLPLGALIWLLIFWMGMEMAGLAIMHSVPGMQAGIAVLNILVLAVITAIVLPGQRLPRSAWVLIGVMILGNLLLAFLYSMEEFGTERLFSGMVQYFATAGIGSLEGLMLVAVGLLFARQHGVLAILVVIGGYSYIFLDSDYLFGYPQREWAWLATYFAGITILYLVVVPLALLRARTRLGRALAVFLPLVIFHGLRITVPLLVIQEPIRVLPGEVVWVINILLSFVLAWVVYNVVEEIQEGAEVESSVLPASLVN